MRRLLSFAIITASLMLPVSAWAAETLTLTTPLTTTQTTWLIHNVVINVNDQSVAVYLVGDQGQRLQVFYPTPPPAANPSQPSGATLLHSLNIANFTTTSLVKNIFNRLITDGYITGTVSGTPQ